MVHMIPIVSSIFHTILKEVEVILDIIFSNNFHHELNIEAKYLSALPIVHRTLCLILLAITKFLMHEM